MRNRKDSQKIGVRVKAPGMGRATVYHQLFSREHTFLRREKETVLAPVGSHFDAEEAGDFDFPGSGAYLSAWEGVITVSANPDENIVHLEYTIDPQVISNDEHR